jgi:hypothetical protein
MTSVIQIIESKPAVWMVSAISPVCVNVAIGCELNAQTRKILVNCALEPLGIKQAKKSRSGFARPWIRRFHPKITKATRAIPASQ